MDFEIKKINGIEQDFVVFSTSYLNPFGHLKIIEKELKCKKIRCIVLFDLLLSNGNGYDRYYELEFENSSFLKETLKIIDLKKGCKQRMILNKYYHDNFEKFDTEILSNATKFLVQKGALKRV
ncbi:hypothetical protein SANA_14180 [Gottschalkiaceae bacterium SANA]|nr:hypothetical protein SANA_14180 [Gottschalkiaceae bacterium SANA]